MAEQRICSLAELESGKPAAFELDGQRLAVVRIEGEVHAVIDRCSHANVRLSEGDVDTAARSIECWKHGSHFDLRTGEPLSLPAVKPVQVFEVVVDGDDVKVVLP